MFFKSVIFFVALFTFLPSFAQQDTLAKPLEEVVITGQYNPQSVSKSVFEVKVISRSDIDRQAGNNLADLLNQTLNINIVPNASSGKSGVQLFGLDSQYFKILVDNIPIINDEGLGNNTDLTQINLDDVQQIEIVEGSMGVEYGANAVSGIINIITKKNSKYKWEITPYVQEETVGNEYSLLDQGRHIQSLKIGHNITDKLYANAVVTGNDFKGFRNKRKGEYYLENDSLRGYEWLPKHQLNLKALLNYNLEKHQIFYKFEYFNEDTERYGAFVLPNYEPSTATTTPTAKDALFNSSRFFHHVNASGKLTEDRFNYDVSLSYQKQEKNVEEYRIRIRDQQHFDVNKYEYESRQGIYSKGNFSNFLKSKTVDFLLGYEISDIDGFASALAGTFDNNNIKRRLGSYDFFGSTEINLTKKLSVRPGARILFSSQFDTQAALSLSAKYDLGRGYEFRTIVGTSPRLPNYEELYTYFVDVNHNVQGNPLLKAEQGVSAFIHLNKNSKTANGFQFQNKFSAWYIDVHDRIELVVIQLSPMEYQYRNIDLFRTIGSSLTTSVAYKEFTANAGFTFAGVSKVLGSGAVSNDDYLYGVQMNVNGSYRLPKYNTTFSLFYKYTGPQYQFVEKSNEVGESILVRGKQSDFAWLDATIRKSVLQNRLEITAGARNILDIKTIKTTATEGGTHTGPATNLMMGYGRSYFLKLLYRLNF